MDANLRKPAHDMAVNPFRPLPDEDREEAAAAAVWLSANRGGHPPESVAHAMRSLAERIEQTILLPEATPDDIVRLCAESRRERFLAVCVSPIHVPLAARELAGARPRIVTVVGFPSGAHPTEMKAREAAWAVEHGAQEIDMVLPIGMLRAGFDGAVQDDIAAVVAAASGRWVKVILEAALLDRDEKVRAVRLAREAGATMVKTSTGFGPGGATEEDVALLRQESGSMMGVKAAGGIRTTIAALRMIACGADRIGSSAGVAILSSAPRTA